MTTTQVGPPLEKSGKKESAAGAEQGEEEVQGFDERDILAACGDELTQDSNSKILEISPSHLDDHSAHDYPLKKISPKLSPPKV